MTTLGIATHLGAQEQPELGPGNIGFVSILNAVSTAAPTHITFGPVKVNGGEPVPGGHASSNLSLFTGDHALTVKNEACDPPALEEVFPVVGGKTLAIVIFTKYKKVGDKMVPEITTSHFSRGAENLDLKLSVVSLSARPEVPVRIRSETIPLRPRAPRSIRVQPDEIVSYQLPGQEEPETIELGSTGHFILFVFDDAKTGKIGGSVLAHVTVELDFPTPASSE